LKNVGNQKVDGTSMVFFFFLQWKSPVNCLITNILQNFFFCVQEKKLIQVWNNLRVGKWWHNLNYGVNYPFNGHKNRHHCNYAKHALKGFCESWEWDEHTSNLSHMNTKAQCVNRLHYIQPFKMFPLTLKNNTSCIRKMQSNLKKQTEFTPAAGVNEKRYYSVGTH